MPYVTNEQYEAYANERGIQINYATIDGDLFKAADFIDTYYNFKGEALQDTAALPTDLVSVADIERAALKAVELQQIGRLTLNAAAMSGSIIESESKSLDGVGSKSVSYQAGTQPTYKARTPELDRLLAPFLAFSGGLRRA